MRNTLTLSGLALLATIGAAHAQTVLNTSALCRSVQAAFPATKITVSGPNKMRVSCPGEKDWPRMSVPMGSLEEMQHAATSGFKLSDASE